MQSTFWTNTSWYLALLMTSLVSMFFIMRRTKSRTFALAFIVAVLGCLYVLEYVIVIVFDAYNYTPKIVGDSSQDAVFGNMFSQISISTTAVLLIVYDLSLVWYALFAVLYFLIEELFVYLGIYQHHWYKSIYTLIALMPLFLFIKFWYYRVIRTSRGMIYYMTLLFGATALTSNLIILPLKLLLLQIFQGVTIFNDLSRNHTAINFFFSLCLINIFIHLHRLTAHWAWKGMVFGALFLAIYLLNQIGIIYIKDGWVAVIILLDLFGSYGFVVLMNQFLQQRDKLRADS